MKKLLAALLLLGLLCAPAYAQKTKSVLTTEVNTNLPDNTAGIITPATVRTTLIDMINSWGGLVDATNTFSGLTTFGTSDVLGSAWIPYTPTLSCGTATFTINSARKWTLGKTTFVSVSAVINTLGTCTNILSIGLPIMANSIGEMSGTEQTTTGASVACTYVASAMAMNCYKTVVANWVAGNTALITGLYENQ